MDQTAEAYQGPEKRKGDRRTDRRSGDRRSQMDRRNGLERRRGPGRRRGEGRRTADGGGHRGGRVDFIMAIVDSKGLN